MFNPCFQYVLSSCKGLVIAVIFWDYQDGWAVTRNYVCGNIKLLLVSSRLGFLYTIKTNVNNWLDGKHEQRCPLLRFPVKHGLVLYWILMGMEAR